MATLITIISVAVLLGLAAAGVYFFGSWAVNDIREMRHHSL